MAMNHVFRAGLLIALAGVGFAQIQGRTRTNGDQVPVRTGFDELLFTLEDPEGALQTMHARDGTLWLEPGRHTWSGYKATLVDRDDVRWRFDCGDRMGEPFTVEGKESRIELCFPLRVEIFAMKAGDKVVFRHKFLGRTGESVQVHRNGQRLPLPFTIETLDGKCLTKATFKYG